MIQGWIVDVRVMTEGGGPDTRLMPWQVGIPDPAEAEGAVKAMPQYAGFSGYTIKVAVQLDEAKMAQAGLRPGEVREMRL